MFNRITIKKAAMLAVFFTLTLLFSSCGLDTDNYITETDNELTIYDEGEKDTNPSRIDPSYKVDPKEEESQAPTFIELSSCCFHTWCSLAQLDMEDYYLIVTVD